MTNDEIIKLLAETTQRSKSNSHRIDELSQYNETLHKMAAALEVLATNQHNMAEQIDKIDSKVTVLETSPAKKLYALIGYIVAALCSAAAGTFLGIYI